METDLPPPSKSRNRQSDGEADAHSEPLFMSGDDAPDGDDFITADSRPTRRVRKRGSSQSYSTIVTGTPNENLSLYLFRQVLLTL